MSNQGKELYEFGPFRLDPGKRLLLRDNQPVPIQLKAFETLLVLVRNSEQVVLKDDLMKTVWPDTFVEESNLTQNIFVLRKTLSTEGGNQRYIVTIPGRGYRFTEKVRVVPIEEALVVASHSRSRVVIEEKKSRLGLLISSVGIVLLLVAGAALGYRYYSGRERARAAPPPRLKVQPRQSVAVLGFQNLSGSNDPAWLSTALSEMLITELGAGDQLRMVSSEEVAQLKASLSLLNRGTLSKDTLGKIRQILGADVVVLGSYSDLGKQSHGQIRLDVRIQDTHAGETVATVSETGTEAGLFSLVTRAGAHLREKLAVPPQSADQAEGVLASLPSDTETARLYAEGLEKLRHFDALGARDLLQKAIHTDPGYALAHSALAEAWSQLGYETKAKAEAKRAVELSDKLSRKDRLFIEARSRGLSNEWDKALELYRTLFQFFPDDIEYGLHLADAQTQAGKREDALVTIQALRQLPPPVKDDPRIDLAEEMNYIRQGQYAMAKAPAARAIEKATAGGVQLLLARALYLEAAALAGSGDGDKAIADAEQSEKIYQSVGDEWGVSNSLEYFAYVYASRDDWEKAEKPYQQALAVNRAIGNQTGAALDLTSLATERGARGDLEGGKKLDEEALAIYREIGDKNREAWALTGISWIVETQGNLAESVRIEDQAVAEFREMADDGGAAYALNGEAEEFTMMGDLARAHQASQQSLELIQKSGNKSLIGRNFFAFGNIAKLEGNLEEAQRNFSQALPMVRDAGDTGMVTEVEQGLAEVANEANQKDEAKRQVNEILTSLRDHKDPADEIGAEGLLARIALEQGDTSSAKQAVADARSLLAKSNGWEERFLFGIANARFLAATGKIAEARESVNRVIAETAKDGNKRYELEARLALCEIEAKADPATARAHAKDLQKEAQARGFGLIARKALAISA